MSRIAIENVSVDFGGVHALSDVSFSFESSSIVGLIGPVISIASRLAH